jgi:5'-deoxynucleotidase YfbR-like HD superfamily hydrolase
MDMSEVSSYVDVTEYDLRSAAMTKRCHTVPTIGHQTVGEHSYHVAMLVIELSDGYPSIELIKAALYHDLAETSTGDIPATTKWRSPLLKQKLEIMEQMFDQRHGLTVELLEYEKVILKVADAMELGFYCVDQLMYGNKHVVPMYRNIVGFLETIHHQKDVQFNRAFAIMFKRLKDSYDNAIR